MLFTATLVGRSYPTAVPEHIADTVVFVPTGVGFTVTTALPVGLATVQPLASVTETIVYVFVDVGLTGICVALT